jgi:hypothetical protein
MSLTYTTALELANSARDKSAGKPIANNTRAILRGDDVAIRLHSTDVLTFKPDGSVIYNTGGWRTVTTKQRMNKYGAPGFRIWSDRGNWYAGQCGKPDYVYAEGVTVHADGSVTGDADAGAASSERNLRRSVKAFAKAYVDALFAGKVGAPDAGDCLICRVFKDKPEGDTSHIASHIEESYFVPTLVRNAVASMGASIAERQTVDALLWNEHKHAFTLDRKSFIAQGVERHLRKYCLRQMGLAY